MTPEVYKYSNSKIRRAADFDRLEKGEKTNLPMKAYTYTKRELQIIRTKKPLPISCEEYLSIYHKSFCRDKIKILDHLADTYPAMTEEVFSSEFEETHGDPADMDGGCRFPILLLTTRCTQGRVMDMTAYLLGRMDAPQGYAKQLRELVPFRLVFNYFTSEYVADFFAVPLWNNYFLGQAELRRVLELRSIRSLEELVERASDYFECLSPYHLLNCPFLPARSAGMSDRRER